MNKLAYTTRYMFNFYTLRLEQVQFLATTLVLVMTYDAKTYTNYNNYKWPQFYTYIRYTGWAKINNTRNFKT